MSNSVKIKRLRTLADAVTKGMLHEFNMRVPADRNHDADLVLSWAANVIEKLEKEYAAEINKRVPVEQRLLDSARGTKPLPNKEDCLKMARILGRD